MELIASFHFDDDLHVIAFTVYVSVAIADRQVLIDSEITRFEDRDDQVFFVAFRSSM